MGAQELGEFKKVGMTQHPNKSRYRGSKQGEASRRKLEKMNSQPPPAQNNAPPPQPGRAYQAPSYLNTAYSTTPHPNQQHPGPAYQSSSLPGQHFVSPYQNQSFRQPGPLGYNPSLTANHLTHNVQQGDYDTHNPDGSNMAVVSPDGPVPLFNRFYVAPRNVQPDDSYQHPTTKMPIDTQTSHNTPPHPPSFVPHATTPSTVGTEFETGPSGAQTPATAATTVSPPKNLDSPPNGQCDDWVDKMGSTQNVPYAPNNANGLEGLTERESVGFNHFERLHCAHTNFFKNIASTLMAYNRSHDNNGNSTVNPGTGNSQPPASNVSESAQTLKKRTREESEDLQSPETPSRPPKRLRCDVPQESQHLSQRRSSGEGTRVLTAVQAEQAHLDCHQQGISADVFKNPADGRDGDLGQSSTSNEGKTNNLYPGALVATSIFDEMGLSEQELVSTCSFVSATLTLTDYRTIQ